MSDMKPAERLRLKTILAYSLPALAIGLSVGPVSAILPSLYAKHAQVSLAAIGTLFAIARIFDAITDPLIGYWSDKTRTPIGARKPWVLVGGMIVTLAVFFLFQIPPEAGIAYFGFWALLYYLGYTMFFIPHMAWGSELTTDYVARARVFTYRSFFDSTGGLLYTLIPMGLLYFGVTQSTEFSPEVFQWMAYAVVLMLPLCIIAAVVWAPKGEVVSQKSDNFLGLFKSASQNKLLMRFLAAYVVGGINSGLIGALFFPFFDAYLSVGAQLPTILLVIYICQIVALPFWQKVVERIGKHRTWAVCWMVQPLALVPLLFFEQGTIPVVAVYVIMGLFGFLGTASAIAPNALLGDIVDYELLRTKVDRAGNYYAFLMLIAKISSATGGIAFIILGAVFGFELSQGAANSDFAMMGLALMFCVIPGLIQFLALPLIWNFPLNRRRHEIIRRRLEQRNMLHHEAGA